MQVYANYCPTRRDRPFSSCYALAVFDQERLTFNPGVMGGKPVMRGMRITVGTILALLRDRTPDAIVAEYPELVEDHRVRVRTLPIS